MSSWHTKCQSKKDCINHIKKCSNIYRIKWISHITNKLTHVLNIMDGPEEVCRKHWTSMQPDSFRMFNVYQQVYGVWTYHIESVQCWLQPGMSEAFNTWPAASVVPGCPRTPARAGRWSLQPPWSQVVPEPLHGQADGAGSL